MSKAVKAKNAGAKKNAKLYNMPEKLLKGTILKDISKVEWCIGTSIGTGGFGEIYTACRLGENNYNYVVKCEPHENGPLFVEMHFYMRIGRLDNIKKFQNLRGLKKLGMPFMVGNGSADINGIRHRFIILPRYGSDIAKHFLANGRRLPEVTAYRIAIQMIDVYQFIHSNGYIHADLKAANILLGYGHNDCGSETYLVDFGLASRFATTEFKPDPKKMHNGTIEYTSRDAHQGVATMRADFEILGYNLIEWLGIELPWVKQKLLGVPANVQKAKESFMANITTNLAELFPYKVPTAISEYMKYVVKLKYNDTPNYEMIRKMFTAALNTLSAPVNGDLIFKLSTLNRYDSLPTTSKTPAALKGKKAITVDSEDELRNASDDDDYDVIFDKSESTKKKKVKELKTSKKVQRNTHKEKIIKKTESPVWRNKYKYSKKSPASSPSPEMPQISGVRKSPRNLQQHSSPLKTKDSNHINSPSTNIPKTIINDQITPNATSNKTYEFNFELDVSMDANVVVNVKRKKRPTQLEQKNSSDKLETIKVSSSGRIVRRSNDKLKKSVTPTVVIKRVRRY